MKKRLYNVSIVVLSVIFLVTFSIFFSLLFGSKNVVAESLKSDAKGIYYADDGWGKIDHNDGVTFYGKSLDMSSDVSIVDAGIGGHSPTSEGGKWIPYNLTDGNYNVWESIKLEDNGWLVMDLGANYYVDRIDLTMWFDHLYKDFVIQLSPSSDFSSVTTIFSNDYDNSLGLNVVGSFCTEDLFYAGQHGEQYSVGGQGEFGSETDGSGHALRFNPVYTRYVRYHSEANWGQFCEAGEFVAYGQSADSTGKADILQNVASPTLGAIYSLTEYGNESNVLTTVKFSNNESEVATASDIATIFGQGKHNGYEAYFICDASGNEKKAWLNIDLGTTFYVSEVDVCFFWDWTFDNITVDIADNSSFTGATRYTFGSLVNNEGTWYNPNRASGTGDANSCGLKLNFSATCGRYVRVFADTDSWGHTGSLYTGVQVIGTKAKGFITSVTSGVSDETIRFGTDYSTTAPTVNYKSSASSATTPYYTRTDNNAQTLTGSWGGAFDKNVEGTYTLTFTPNDTFYNVSGTAFTKTVTVAKEADQLADDKIQAIENVITTSNATIDVARSAYDALTPGQKALVPSASVTYLTESESVKSVVTVIGNIANIISSSDTTVSSARTAYDGISSSLQVRVGNYSDLTDGESIKTVVDDINDIGEVTALSEDDITAARTSYDGLSSSLQERVGNYSDLTAAEIKYPIERDATDLDMKMTVGASIRYTSGSTGIRFMVSFDKDIYEAFLADGYTVQIGILIGPYDYLARKGGSFTKENASTSPAIKDITADADKIVCVDGVLYVQCALTNILEKNYARNFVGVGYMSFTKDGVNVVKYADASENVRSVYYVAVRALTNALEVKTEAQIEILEGFINTAIENSFSNIVIENGVAKATVKDGAYTYRPTIYYDADTETIYDIEEVI